VCLRYGHAWEGSYEIRHSLDGPGHKRADYYGKSLKVPSPLTANKCRVCRGCQIRILRPGRARSARPWLGLTPLTGSADARRCASALRVR
jgi:hypothetical protein